MKTHVVKPERAPVDRRAGLLRLKVLVLVCGAALMSIEIVGSRIISPFFGNSIYSWGSLISVFMGALSLGYYLGGKLVDRRPSVRLLGSIIAASGVLLIIMRFVGAAVCERMWSAGMGTRLGALLTSVILFLPPGVLMGMVSPFSVRLAARAVRNVGSTAGVFYSLSSLGSIIGTLGTALLLIDLFGVTTIVLGNGVVLIVVALTCAGLLIRNDLETVPPTDETWARERHGPPEEDEPPARLWQLILIVMVSGGVLMGLEIAAARLISPYFGQGVYVWGSLISVFLAALAAGYYLGGRLADRRPALSVLGTVITLACLAMLLLRYAAPGIAEGIAGISLGTKLGTLLTSVVLFIVPSLLMGMVSPFAVRLTARAVGEVGKISGLLYALSTVGSIIGTLLSSFVLIDLIGAGWTVLVLALVLLAVSVTAAGVLSFRRRLPPIAIPAAVLVVISLIVSPPRAGGIIAKGLEIVYETDSAYQHIVVCEGVLDNPYNDVAPARPRRNLQFDRYTESAIYIDDINDGDPDAATTYTDLMHLPLIFNPHIKTMLMIGGGGGTVPRQYRRHYGCEVDVAEIDPKVVQVSKDWFYLEPDDKLRVHVEDGRLFLKRTDKQYDAILVDAFTGGGQIPFHLTTKEFFEEVQRHLAPGGVLAMNVINSLDGPKGKLYRAIMKTWRAAGYAQIYVFPKYYSSSLVRDEDYNLILIGTMSDQRLSRAQIESRALELYRSGIVQVNNFTFHAGHYLPDESLRPFDDAPVLTDDYAPVELMVLE